MPRRSSSSGSTPSRIAPPSRASAGGSSTMRRADLVAHLGEVVQLADEAPDERRLQLVEQHAHARDGDERLPQRDEIARAGGAERRARDEALDVVDRLQRVAQLAAFGRRGTRAPRPRRADPGSVRATTSGAQQPAAQQRAAHRRLRAVDLVEQRSGTAAVRRSRRPRGAAGRGIDDQAVGAGAITRSRGRARDRPSACRAGTARARRRRETAAGCDRRGRTRRGSASASARAACAAPSRRRTSRRRLRVTRHVAGAGGSTSAAASVESGRARRSRAAAARRARRRAPGARRRRGTRRREFAGRQVEQRDARQRRSLVPARRAMMNAGSRASR